MQSSMGLQVDATAHFSSYYCKKVTKATLQNLNSKNQKRCYHFAAQCHIVDVLLTKITFSDLIVISKLIRYVIYCL